MTRVLKIWIISLILTSTAVWLCYRWLDQPIALWVHGATGNKRLPAALVDSPFSSTSFISACAFVICGLAAISGRRFTRPETTITMGVISMVSTVVIKDQLKILFGRTWPQMFINNGVYGFNYFHYGHSFESFPSGHAAVAAAFLFIPWFLFSKLRTAMITFIIAVDIGLVMLNIHFLSDVIAGSFLGFSIALFTISLWRAARFPSGLRSAPPLGTMKNKNPAAPAPRGETE
jgi:membrane-associated phospholipid phosphatase